MTFTHPDPQWFSDEALGKQALVDELNERGETVPLDLMCGLLEPRVHPTEAEQCDNCRSDARDEVGGLEFAGKRRCGICVGRGRHNQHAVDAYGEAAAALLAIREWCDRTQHAASMTESEPVFQARMELVDEVRSLLPPVPAVGEDKP
jgi:hypothetical protein